MNQALGTLILRNHEEGRWQYNGGRPGCESLSAATRIMNATSTEMTPVKGSCVGFSRSCLFDCFFVGLEYIAPSRGQVSRWSPLYSIKSYSSQGLSFLAGWACMSYLPGPSIVA